MISLDGTASLWTVGILGFLLGTLLGCIVAWFVIGRNGRTLQLQLELEQLKERFTDYRDQVTQHFMRTSDLVQEMTQSYRAVYEHLAAGAQHLCAEPEDTTRLEQQRDPGRIGDAGAHTITDDADAEYDELSELSNIKKDIEELLGESPRISELDIRVEEETGKKLQH
ncbi:MAG: DUF1043 family protein [Gammaproteobacteria bacterium]|jgi:uncharacterized membrane-anchored protein YhcB (DUF1043 family)